MNVGGFLLVSDEDCVAALCAGATANLVRFCRLKRRNRLLGKKGGQRVSPHPSSASFCFRDHAAGIPTGIARNKGQFSAFAMYASSPAFLRKGAMAGLGGQLDIPRDLLVLRKRGVTGPRE